MLLKNKKRIAALLTAVVIVLTTAFSLPGVTMAEEDTATGSDAVETEETTDASTEAMEETEEAVEDLSSSLKIHSRYWDGWIIGDYLNVTASGYTPSLHGALKATDSAGQETEAYCMQSRKSSAQTDKVYTEGKPLWLTDAETAADIALMMFAYGGRRADPNAYDGRNTQDGGTYGTYIIDGVPTGGLMVAGQVCAMTRDEARAVTQVAVHSTVSDCNISAVSGKNSGENVSRAYTRMKVVAQAAYNLRANGVPLETVAELVDNTEAYKPVQTITTQIYNVKGNKWENYSGSILTDDYRDGSGQVTFRIHYFSSGICNKLLTNTSSGNVTVTHSGRTMNLNGVENYYDYLTIQNANAAVTADYGPLESGTQTVYDTLTQQDVVQHTFEQTVTVKAAYDDMKQNKLTFTAATGTGAAHTPYRGDGDNDGVTNYAARIFNNPSYQDACFVSPNQSLSKQVTVTASAQQYGSISIHKYNQDTGMIENAASYSLKGAVFGVFKTRADAVAATETNKNAVTTITTDESGNGKTGKLLYGTYYVKETKAPYGFLTNKTVYTANINSETPVQLEVPEKPDCGNIRIHKYSVNPEMTDENDCYNLEGAVFGVFRTRADAVAATETNKNAVTTITTNASGNGEAENLPAGTYYVKETKAPKGYRINTTIYATKTASDTPVQLEVPETPENDPAGLQVRKKDDTHEIYLEGCVFVIKYYDVQMDTNPANAGKTAVRTWYMKTDSDGKIDLEQKYLQSNSDPLYYGATNTAVIPLGTITIQEIQAPEGYILDDTIRTFVIRDNPEGIPHVEFENQRTIPNTPMKQPFELVKLAEGKNNTTYPLANAGFSACRVNDLTEVDEAYQAEDGEIIVQDDSGKYYIWDADKAVVLTEDGKTELFTDKNGYAKSVPLEYGKYIVAETTVPHNFHEIAPFVVNITENSEKPVEMGYFTDKSFKAYVRIIKKDDTSGQKIISDSATFKIWSYDDKSYVEFAQTAEDGSVTKVSEFSTKDGVIMTPGTLMPGKYRIEETKAPEGYYNRLQNKSYDITIDADAVYKVYETPEGQITDMGVFEYEIDNTPYTGNIRITKNGQSLTYREETKEFETADIRLSGITFKIYADEDILAPDGSGDTLYRKDTLADTVVTDENGIAESKMLPIGTYRIEEDTPEGYVKLDPVTVKLQEGQKNKILSDDGSVQESITYELTIQNKLLKPSIHTTAKDSKGNHQVMPEETVTITDTVSCDSIIAGKRYRLTGYPVYASDGTRVSVNGKNIEESIEFTAKKAKQDVDVSFTFDASALEGKSIVFYEYLYLDGNLVAKHDDIKDKGQTIAFAKIHTTAKDENGNKIARPVENVKIVDTVDYENLTPGTYTVTGYPVYAKDGKRVSVNGKNIENTVTFTVTETTGKVDVPYIIDASALDQKSIVFYEYVYLDGELVAKHEDITDRGQTVAFEDIVKTGDTAKPLIPIAIGIAAAAGITVLLIRKKKMK